MASFRPVTQSDGTGRGTDSDGQFGDGNATGTMSPGQAFQGTNMAVSAALSQEVSLVC